MVEDENWSGEPAGPTTFAMEDGTGKQTVDSVMEEDHVFLNRKSDAQPWTMFEQLHGRKERKKRHGKEGKPTRPYLAGAHGDDD